MSSLRRQDGKQGNQRLATLNQRFRRSQSMADGAVISKKWFAFSRMELGTNALREKCDGQSENNFSRKPQEMKQNNAKVFSAIKQDNPAWFRGKSVYLQVIMISSTMKNAKEQKYNIITHPHINTDAECLELLKRF